MSKQIPVLCDRCGSAITLTGYRARNPKDGRELLLCLHHEREHDAALTKQGWEIERLTPPEPQSGDKVRTRCGRCGGVAFSRPVKASPESHTVDVVHCKDCDTRTCGSVVGKDYKNDLIRCDGKAMTSEDPICPKGHSLMGGAS